MKFVNGAKLILLVLYFCSYSNANAYSNYSPTKDQIVTRFGREIASFDRGTYSTHIFNADSASYYVYAEKNGRIISSAGFAKWIFNAINDRDEISREKLTSIGALTRILYQNGLQYESKELPQIVCSQYSNEDYGFTALAIFYILNNEPDSAELLFQNRLMLLQDQNKQERWKSNFSSVYYNLKDYRQVISYTDKILPEVKGKSIVGIHYNRACAFALLNELESMVDELKQVSELQKNFAIIHYTRDWILSDKDFKEVLSTPQFINVLNLFPHKSAN